MKKSQDPTGRWELVRPLTESGQAWLFVVTDSSGERIGEHVRKVLKNRSRIERFEREIAVTNALAETGARVVPIVDVYGGPESAAPYYVMPFYDSGDFRGVLNSSVLTGDITNSIAFARQLHITLSDIHRTTSHRDLKPENILIDRDGTPLLCDFGLCLLLDDESTIERQSDSLEQMGSRHYIAPEAFAGWKAVDDPRALDMYSVGKIFYEALSGRLLPGIALPDGEFDLSTRKPFEVWNLLNRVVAGLVAHEPAVRRSAWGRLATLLDLVEQRMTETPTSGDPDAFESRIAGFLAANPEAQQGARRAELTRRRTSYGDTVRHTVVNRLRTNPLVERLRKMSQGDNPPFRLEDGDNLTVSYLSSNPSCPAWPVASGLSLDPTTNVVFLRIHWHTARLPVPTLVLRTALDEASGFQVMLALFVDAGLGPAEVGGERVAGECEGLDSAVIDDMTYLEEVLSATDRWVTKWLRLFDRCIATPGE